MTDVASTDEGTRLREARRLTAGFRELYPYEPHFLDLDGGAMHYVDEGPREAPVLLCVHGNPTWSFYWRSFVEAMAGDMRVIAPDHIGCGLSDKPQDWPYTLESHVQNLQRLVEALGLRDVTLAVHDWGGPIGFGVATRRPERFARLFVTNTAAFPGAGLPAALALCRLPLVGPLLIRGLNAFARGATRTTTVRPLPAAVRRAYLAPYDSFANRIANWRFVKDIPMRPDHPSYATLSAIDAGLARLADKPTCIVWGERDWVFTPDLRRAWQERFPRAEVHPIEDAGHYLLEDAGERVVAHLRSFLQGTREPSAPTAGARS